jgi:tetratricopeptide (TPR) repeat protein
MRSADNDELQKKRNLAARYSIVAYVFLFLMALCSSLGAAFVWIFCGAALFFVFLALRAYMQGQRAPGYEYTNSYRSSYSETERREGIFDFLQRMFRRGSSSGPLLTKQRGVVIFVVFFVGSIIAFIVFFISIVSEVTSSGMDSNMYQMMGDDFYSRSEFDSAAVSYRRAIAADENSAAAYYGLGNVQAMKEQYDSSLYFYEKTLSIDPEHLNAAYGRGWVFYMQKQHDKSLQAMRYVMERSQDYTDAYLLAGDNHYVRENYDSAMYYYEPAYERGARSKDLLNIMAYIYDVQGKTGKAIPLYKETLEYDSTLTDVYRRLGELIPGENGDYYRRKAAGQQW